MNVVQLDLHNKNRVDDFLRLPFSIYRDIPHWVPPLQMDERLKLNSKRFPFYKHSHASFFLAYKRSSLVDEGTRPIGRLAVLDNRHYNDFKDTQEGKNERSKKGSKGILGNNRCGSIKDWRNEKRALCMAD